MDAVTHHGRETAYRYDDRGGDGRGLCLVHGSGATHALWKAQTRLARDRPVASLDLSGHGASSDVDAAPGYATLEAYTSDVLAVQRATETDVLVGNSLGGAVIMHAVLERGADPDALVLTGTGARLGVLEDLRTWLAEDFDRAVEFLHAPDRLFHDPPEELRASSIETMRACGRAVTARDFETCHRFDVRERLDAIDVPTLVIGGEHDQLTPPWYHEYLAAEIPSAALRVIPDAAHLAMLERPDAFNRAVTAFLATELD